MFEEEKEKENENNAIKELKKAIEALMHNRRYELNMASEEVKRIREELGIPPK